MLIEHSKMLVYVSSPASPRFVPPFVSFVRARGRAPLQKRTGRMNPSQVSGRMRETNGSGTGCEEVAVVCILTVPFIVIKQITHPHRKIDNIGYIKLWHHLGPVNSKSTENNNNEITVVSTGYSLSSSFTILFFLFSGSSCSVSC